MEEDWRGLERMEEDWRGWKRMNRGYELSETYYTDKE